MIFEVLTLSVTNWNLLLSQSLCGIYLMLIYGTHNVVFVSPST